MAGRTRTTKRLAQRINLDYFKTVHGIPRWRRILSVVFTLLGVAWLGWHGLRGSPAPYNAGPVSHSHGMFGQKCSACHVTKGFTHNTTDQACLACHDGPVHQASQTFTPRCTDCHVEHQGSVRLASTTDSACTQCHADLKTKDAKLQFAANVTGFAGKDHPEFAPLRPGHSDPGTIKFNHQVHLDPKKGIRGPHGMVMLKCDDCHRNTGLSEPWPYLDPILKPVALTTGGPNPAPAVMNDRSYMGPVNYEKHCSSCHTLQFDKRFQESVPHKEPKVVYDFVLKKFTEYIAAHPNEIHTVDEPDKRLPTRPPQAIPRNAQEWIQNHMSDAELLLWRKACKECHTMNYKSGEPLPEVAKAQITPRWLTHANFDHESHRMLDCKSCHTRVESSKETSDVLIPGIKVCQDCHRSGANAAEARCFECHSYHDWSKEKRVSGAFTVTQLTQ